MAFTCKFETCNVFFFKSIKCCKFSSNDLQVVFQYYIISKIPFYLLPNVFVNHNCLSLRQADVLQLLHSFNTLSLCRHQVANCTESPFMQVKNRRKLFTDAKIDLTKVKLKKNIIQPSKLKVARFFHHIELAYLCTLL